MGVAGRPTTAYASATVTVVPIRANSTRINLRFERMVASFRLLTWRAARRWQGPDARPTGGGSELEGRAGQLDVGLPMRQPDRELGLALHRLRGDDVAPRKRLRAVLDPDLPVDLVSFESKVIDGHTIDGFPADELAPSHLLGEDVIRMAVQKVGSRGLEVVLFARQIDGGIELGRRGHGSVGVVGLAVERHGLAVVPE